MLYGEHTPVYSAWCRVRKDMRELHESYRPLGDEEDGFDIRFRQAQGAEAIFNAAQDLLDAENLRKSEDTEPSDS